MAALPHPLADDVVIRHQSLGPFTIAVGSGAPQLQCASLDEAIERAGRFATKRRVEAWYMPDDRTSAPVHLLRRIWNEYIEMPGLRLTLEQARRLWTIDTATCSAVLESLVDLKLLVRGRDGNYARSTEGAVGGLRMAKAAVRT